MFNPQTQQIISIHSREYYNWEHPYPPWNGKVGTPKPEFKKWEEKIVRPQACIDKFGRNEPVENIIKNIKEVKEKFKIFAFEFETFMYKIAKNLKKEYKSEPIAPWIITAELFDNTSKWCSDVGGGCEQENCIAYYKSDPEGVTEPKPRFDYYDWKCKKLGLVIKRTRKEEYGGEDND